MPRGKPHYLKVKQAAAFLGVSLATLRAWDRRKKLKARRDKKNGYRLYRLADLKQFLAFTERRKYNKTTLV